jgi:hypothetical protein
MNLYLATFPMHLNGFLDRILIEPDDEPIKLLASFHYFKKINFDDLAKNFSKPPMIFADSGAYSAASQGAPVDVDEYAEWLHQWKHHFTAYSNLDVIRDPKGTAKNQKRLESKGLQPIPVFHTGSDFKHLDSLAKEHPYIALGGMVGQPRPACLKWSATCMTRTKDQGTRFHGFGMTSREVMESLPWHSVDSSSWVAGAKFGQVTLFDGRSWVKAKVGDKKEIGKIAHLIRFYGFDAEQFSSSARYSATKGHINISIISAISWRRYEKYLVKKRQVLSSIYAGRKGRRESS